ncbi:hypothetical protein Hanom_Chr15g01413751 [Helianthus anomalus]
MFVHSKRTKFLVRVRLFNKRTNTNKLPAERFTNGSLMFGVHKQNKIPEVKNGNL